MAYQAARRRQMEVQIAKGFSDLTQAHLSVLVYPPPDGVRPSELAERIFMTKQALNYLLKQLEDRGYIERRSEKGRREVRIYLTRRGWRFFETQWSAMQALEDEWAALFVPGKFEEFLRILRACASVVRDKTSGRPPAPSAQPRRQRRRRGSV
jgi:DNA-binding MarR family transcriptional regulator